MRLRLRHGSVSPLFAFMLIGMLGMGALAIDLSLARLARAELQQVADAASQAAVIALRREGDSTIADTVAREVVAANLVVGQVPTVVDIEFGAWDGTTFIEGGVWPNAARTRVGLVGDNALDYHLGRLLGVNEIELTATAVSATRRLQVALVMDITASWDKDDFYKARSAAVGFLDVLHQNHTAWDQIGMALFMNRYGWEFTPFTYVDDSANNSSLVRDKWSVMNIGSLAGDYQAAWETNSSKHIACRVYATNNSGNSNPFSGWCNSGSSCYNSSKRNNFTASTPTGGCFPSMPRYYSDEGGTDHTTGLEMARLMFDDAYDPVAYRAIVVLTDGEPVGYTGTGSTGARATAGYSESRFREYKRSSSHTTSQIQTDTPLLAQEMYTEDGIHIWFVSFRDYGSFMEDSAQGDGYFVRTNNSNELINIFEEIARSLPVAIVE